MPIKFLILGGGLWVFGGGVEVPILFLWAGGFFRLMWGTRLVHPNLKKKAESYKVTGARQTADSGLKSGTKSETNPPSSVATSSSTSLNEIVQNSVQ